MNDSHCQGSMRLEENWCLVCGDGVVEEGMGRGGGGLRCLETLAVQSLMKKGNNNRKKRPNTRSNSLLQQLLGVFVAGLLCYCHFQKVESTATSVNLLSKSLISCALYLPVLSCAASHHAQQ